MCGETDSCGVRFLEKWRHFGKIYAPNRKRIGAYCRLETVRVSSECTCENSSDELSMSFDRAVIVLNTVVKSKILEPLGTDD